MKPTKQLKRVVIMAGGTGGHVFPGLAIANYLRQQNVEVHWLGTQQGLESRLVPEANIPLHFVAIGGLRGKGIKTLLSAPMRISTAIKQSLSIIKKVNPDVVIGMGGFVSGPGGIAAWLSRRPLIIHEQNAKAGMTNKLLALFSKRVLAGFPDAFKSTRKVIAIGNPVREEILALPAPKSHAPDRRFRLLVLGGSLGAQAINDLVPRALAKLTREERPEVWHQTGDKLEKTQQIYADLGVEANLTPFIKDMANAYAWPDMVLCRAGALTVAELCAAGLGAIFIPYPFAVDDHQTANAEFMVKHHAAICRQQAELTEDKLADIMRQFAQSSEKRLVMGQAAYALRKTDVAQQFYKIICEVVSH